MANILYISAHPLDESASNSVAVGRVFLQEYRKANPQDKVTELDLFESWIPFLDKDVFSGWGKLQSGVAYDQLSVEEQSKIGRLSELVDQFIQADKYVFVTPMWNFSYPPVMKAYIDAVSVAGKTFKYTEQGPVGLLSGRKALHIQSRGGIYSEGPFAPAESGHHHLNAITRFLGFEDLQGLFIEGHNMYPDKAESIKQEAFSKARRLALSF